MEHGFSVELCLKPEEFSLPFLFCLVISLSLIVPLYYKEAAVSHCHKWIIHLFQCVTYGREKIILSRERKRFCRLDDLLREKNVKCSEERCLEAQEKSSFRLRRQTNILLKRRSCVKAHFIIEIVRADFFSRQKVLSLTLLWTH